MKTYRSFSKFVFTLGILISLSLSVFAQEIRITGKVVNASDNKPLPGTTVIIKHTTRGVVTDENGEFSITAQVGDSLTFSFIGFLPQTVKVKKRNYSSSYKKT